MNGYYLTLNLNKSISHSIWRHIVSITSTRNIKWSDIKVKTADREWNRLIRARQTQPLLCRQQLEMFQSVQLQSIPLLIAFKRNSLWTGYFSHWNVGNGSFLPRMACNRVVFDCIRSVLWRLSTVSTQLKMIELKTQKESENKWHRFVTRSCKKAALERYCRASEELDFTQHLVISYARLTSLIKKKSTWNHWLINSTSFVYANMRWSQFVLNFPPFLAFDGHCWVWDQDPLNSSELNWIQYWIMSINYRTAVFGGFSSQAFQAFDNGRLIYWKTLMVDFYPLKDRDLSRAKIFGQL